MMAGFLLMIILLFVAFYIMQERLGISRSDTDIMCFGVLAFGGLEVFVQLTIGLFTGATGGMLLTLLLALVIYSGIAYYFFKRSGL